MYEAPKLEVLEMLTTKIITSSNLDVQDQGDSGEWDAGLGE